MKNMKSKLLASVAMLVVSTIMLTSASFAWFTISTAPEIKGITTTVVTNETLEIALNKAAYTSAASVDDASTYSNASLSGNYYTWGNLVDLTAAEGNTAAAAYADLDKTLRPAKLLVTKDGDGKITATKFQAPTYGEDGRISDMGDLTAVAAPDDAKDGFGLLIVDKIASGGSAGNGKYDEGEYVYGYYIDYWMRSNVGGEVVLSTTGLDRDASDSTGNTGTGSTFTAGGNTDAHKALAANIRIAFQDVTDTTKTNLISEIVPTASNPADEKATFSGTVIKSLTANTAAKIRVFVYLDGTNVKNADASIDTASITGALNLQFTIAEVKSADGKTITTNGVNTSMLTEQTTVPAT